MYKLEVSRNVCVCWCLRSENKDAQYLLLTTKEFISNSNRIYEHTFFKNPSIKCIKLEVILRSVCLFRFLASVSFFPCPSAFFTIRLYLMHRIFITVLCYNVIHSWRSYSQLFLTDTVLHTIFLKSRTPKQYQPF